MPSYTFFCCGDYLKFLMGLGKFRQKSVTSYTFCSLWRLTWVFDGTLKNFHKNVCPVTRFFAVETILSFWVDLEIFDKKVWPVTHFFFAVQTILSFWWDLGKFSQKSVPSHTFLRCWDYLNFLMGLGKFRQKGVTSYTFFSQCRLSWVFDGSWKVSTKKVWPVTRFFAVETNLSFWWDLEKFSQKKCEQSQVSSLWRLTWVFDAT